MPIKFSSVKSRQCLHWYHLFEEYVSWKLCVICLGRIFFALWTVSLEMMSGHVQGSVLKLFVFIFNPCLIYLCRSWIYIYLLLSVMAKLRGVSSTSGNSIKRRSSNLAKPKLSLVRTSHDHSHLSWPISEVSHWCNRSMRVIHDWCEDRWLCPVVLTNRVWRSYDQSCRFIYSSHNLIWSNIVYIIDTPYKLYHQPIHHY